jgi:glycine/D-amino acid oxidase-like deaminating enzyme
VTAALITPGYREAVLWQEQVAGADAGAHDGDGHLAALPAAVDAVVVGGGYAGLSAARELAAAGRSVLVLDAGPLGSGASTRNGGMVIPELKAGPSALEKHYGPLGRRLYAEVNAAFDHVESLAAGPGAPIGCDYERTGQLYLAHHPRVVPGMRAAAREHADELGEPVRFVPREGLASEVGTTAYHGGLVYGRTGGLHPARFHAGLARLARAAGVTVADRTRAIAVERRPGRAGVRVVTDRGTVEAQDLVVTTNAYADGLVAPLARRVLPVGSFIVATEPLDPDLAASVNPHRRMLVDSKNFLYYWRPSPDGRLLFGGRRSLASSTIEQARDFLYAAMVAVHPQLAGVRVDRAWGGEVAVTLDRLPHAGRVDGAWYATGCNGSGVAQLTWLGAQVGRHVAGEGPPPAFAELPHRAIPAHRLRRAYLPAVGLWFRWQDRGFRPAG